MKHIVFLILIFISLQISSRAAAVEENGAEEDILENTLAKEQRKIPALERRANLRILYYKPIYLAYGNPSTKVQYSFRAPLIDGVPINFAYSQIIFWNLLEESKPFFDATYNPEIFYRHKLGWTRLQSLDIGVWEHNSNGKAGAASRSIDQSYLRLNYAFEGPRWITQLSTKLRIPYNQENPHGDLQEYLGPLDIQLQFLQLFDGWLDETELTLEASPGGRWADRWDRGGYTVGLNFRLGPLKVIPAFYLQYYHGYSETLINYNRSVDQFRAGLSF